MGFVYLLVGCLPFANAMGIFRLFRVHVSNSGRNQVAKNKSGIV